MAHRWSVWLFYALTAVSLVSGGLVLWRTPMSLSLWQMYDLVIHLITQGMLTIWCLRDLYKRRFSDQRTLLNWFAAILFLDVFATTAYLFRVKLRQWVPD